MKLLSKSLFCLCSIALVGIPVCLNTHLASAQDQVSPEVAFVTGGIQNARLKLGSMQADLSFTETPPQTDPFFRSEFGDIKNPRVIDSKLRVADSFLSMTTRRTNDWRAVFSRSESLLINGKKAEIIETNQDDKGYYGKAEYSRGIITQSETVLSNGIWKGYSFYDPRRYAYYWGTIPLDEEMQKERAKTKFLGEEAFRGSRCMKLEFMTTPTSSKAVIWVDVEHGFIIRKTEEYVRLKPSMRDDEMLLDSTSETTKIQESEGIWFPAEVEAEIYLWAEMADSTSPTTTPPKSSNSRERNKILKSIGNYVTFEPTRQKIVITNFKASYVPTPADVGMEWPLDRDVIDLRSREVLGAIALTPKELDKLNVDRKNQNKVPLEATPLSTKQLSQIRAEDRPTKPEDSPPSLLALLSYEEWQDVLVLRGKKPKKDPSAALPRAEDDPTNVIAKPTVKVKVGDAAPNFSVTDMNGKEWKLSELKGKKNLILTFFPKCFTGGCANHLSSLRDHQSEFDATDTQILAVSVDPAEGEKGQKAFAAQWKLGFPMIPDTSRALSQIYGAAQNDKQLAARMSVLIDKAGIVRWIDTDVHVQTHGADVLAKIGELNLNTK